MKNVNKNKRLARRATFGVLAIAASALLIGSQVPSLGGGERVLAQQEGAQQEGAKQKTAMPQFASAIFAGGCFWCVESDFDKVPGVVATTSGYAGGTLANPTYKTVTGGNSGHYEVVKVDYDPSEVSYKALLTAFWHSVDPTDPGGQFCDRGHSYKTAIITNGPEEAAAAEAFKAQLIADGKEIVTPILGSATFYPAETYHQDYYMKNPLRYGYYRRACGRDNRVKAVWGADAYKGIPGKELKS